MAFTNRVGDLYVPANRGDAQLPTLAVAGPFGAVKEQSAGLNAQTMAERGFVTLALDPSFVGESGGQVHIQWHVLFMFGPSFFTGKLMARFGKECVTAVGVAVITASAVVALSGMAVGRFGFR